MIQWRTWVEPTSLYGSPSDKHRTMKTFTSAFLRLVKVTNVRDPPKAR